VSSDGFARPRWIGDGILRTALDRRAELDDGNTEHGNGWQRKEPTMIIHHRFPAL
jgi:hypothetical protein